MSRPRSETEVESCTGLTRPRSETEVESGPDLDLDPVSVSVQAMPRPRLGLASARPRLVLVDRERIVGTRLGLASSLYYGPMGQIGHLPLVGCLDVYIDESRREPRRVIYTGPRTEAVGRGPGSCRTPPMAGGPFPMPARRAWSTTVSVACSGG